MKHIYVSPHSDDVALSCGGQILSYPGRANDTLVLNIFTSQSDAPGAMENSFQDSINPERTSEDKAAWDSIGVQTRYADLPEALLRKRFPFAILPRSDDPAMMDRLHAVLASYAQAHPDALFHFPAGFGNHVDHLACRKAGFRLLDEGLVGRIRLYEDIPYCWLRSIRDQHYAGLLRTVDLEEEDRATAFRPDGETMAHYLGGTSVPFPRGKKLFAAVYLSLLAGNRLHGLSRKPALYAGRMTLVDLDEGLMERKKALLFHYASQLPMLFGPQPEDTLRRHRASFSKEVEMEVAIKRAFAQG